MILLTDSPPSSSGLSSSYNDLNSESFSLIKSEISIIPKPEDNGLSYSCLAIHPALSKPLRKSVNIDVLYPPGPPEIGGYFLGDIARAGDTLTLTCKSKGGNPLAQLVWFKNGEQIDFSYDTFASRESINEHQFIVDSSHNNAVYRCDAISPINSKPLSSMIQLAVQCK